MAIASIATLCGLSFEPFCNFALSLLYIYLCSFIYMSLLFWFKTFPSKEKKILAANSVINQRSGTAVILLYNIIYIYGRTTALYIILRSLSFSHYLVLEVHDALRKPVFNKTK